jgi:hypothetical protein
MYIRINEDGSVTYPYTIQMFRDSFESLSFPQEIGNAVLSEYGVYPVAMLASPKDHTKNYFTDGVENIDGRWVSKWREEDASEEEIAERAQIQLGSVRIKRNALLAASDWTQLPDSPLDNTTRNAWADYRQALRDITEQADPFAIVFPDAP